MTPSRGQRNGKPTQENPKDLNLQKKQSGSTPRKVHAEESNVKNKGKFAVGVARDVEGQS